MLKSLFITLLIFYTVVVTNAQKLSGKVFDKDTKETLPGAVVFISDLKIGAVTDPNGHYEIKNLPKSKFVVQVKLLGYSTVNSIIDISKTTQKDFALTASALESPEVVITGSAFASEQTHTSVPVVPVDKIDIVSVGADNIVNALVNTPGVSSINTGNAISKPVIRGLGYNRIVTVNEGVRQEGQQWGDEHGLEIDQFSADKIEILKGPSSLLYGSDALGGVINILEPIPPANGKISGEINSNFSTNNFLLANSLMIEGNQNGFVWRLRGTYKNAKPYQTPAERVFNSAFNEKSGEGLIGFNRGWGYSHLHFSRWDSNIGLIEGERDSLTGKFIDTDGNIATDAELKSRSPFLPFQNVCHNKISLVNNIIVGESQLRINGGWQQNDRKEFWESFSEPNLWFHLSTFTYDAKYYFPQKDSLEAVIGTSGMSQKNKNKGNEFLIPDYQLMDFGVFVSLKKTFNKTTYNAGVRYDRRHIAGDELMADSTKVFAPLESDFSAISASIGATYQLSNVWNMKANIGRGFRAPNISELSANGVHEGTFRYEIGNPNLNPETSLQFDMGIAAEGKKISVSLDVFYNIIDNFIYYRHFYGSMGDTIIIDGQPIPAYYYVQGNSTLKGFEFSFDIHPINNLHFENSMAYVEGRNNSIDLPLPYIPPIKIENELRYTFKTAKEKPFSEPYIKATLVNGFKQDKVDAFETATAGYTLINAGVGTNIRIGHQKALFFINANNLTNTKYFNHLSRLKEMGIDEMGTNITFGVGIPFGLK